MNSTKTATLSLWITLTCFVGFGMFVMKNQVQNLELELAGINQNIDEDIKTIHILKAEWSHLNSPSRLRALASKHSSLNPIRAEQIINYSELPFNEGPVLDKTTEARKNISNRAEQNRNLKQLVAARH